MLGVAGVLRVQRSVRTAAHQPLLHAANIARTRRQRHFLYPPNYGRSRFQARSGSSGMDDSRASSWRRAARARLRGACQSALSLTYTAADLDRLFVSRTGCYRMEPTKLPLLYKCQVRSGGRTRLRGTREERFQFRFRVPPGSPARCEGSNIDLCRCRSFRRNLRPNHCCCPCRLAFRGDGAPYPL